MKKLSVLFIILCFTVLAFGQVGTKNIMYKGTDGRIYVVKEADLRPAISASTGNPDSLGGHKYTEYFLVAVNDTITAIVWFQNDSTVFDSTVIFHDLLKVDSIKAVYGSIIEIDDNIRLTGDLTLDNATSDIAVNAFEDSKLNFTGSNISGSGVAFGMLSTGRGYVNNIKYDLGLYTKSILRFRIDSLGTIHSIDTLKTDSVFVANQIAIFYDTLRAENIIKLNRESGNASAILEIRGGNTADAAIWLYADRGDENFDFWRLTAAVNGQFQIYNQDAGKVLLKIDSTGTVHIADTLRADSVLLLKGINILSIVSDSTDSVKSAFKESSNVIFLDTTKTGVDYSDDFILGVHVPGNALYPVGQGFFFDNSKYAIGVGYDALGDNWLHEDSVGLGSISVGRNVRAPGAQAAAFGWGNVAGGTQSLVGGLGNKALGNVSIAFGQDMTVSGTLSIGISLDATTRVLSQSNTVAIMDGKVGIDTLLPDVEFHVKGGVKADSFLLGNVNLMDSTIAIINDSTDKYAIKAAGETITGFWSFMNGVYSAYFNKYAFFESGIKVGLPTSSGRNYVTIKKEITMDDPNPVRGFRATLHNDVEGLTGNMYGSEMFMKYETDSSYTTGEVFGYTSDVQMRANGTNTVGYFVAHADNYGTGNGVGLFLTNIRARRTGNAYGIYIADGNVTSDSGSAYVIYSSEKSPSYFAGRMQFGDTLFVNAPILIDSTNILDIISDSISYAKIDSINLLGEALPFDIISFGDFYGLDPEFSAKIGNDTLEVIASMDTTGFGGKNKYIPVMTARVPEDTASTLQNYFVYSPIMKVPYGFTGIDSIQFKYRTKLPETDTCKVSFRLHRWNSDGTISQSDVDDDNTSLDIWTTASLTPSTVAIGRYDKFLLTTILGSLGHAWYAKIADIRIYWKVGS